jgi:hypothetical protein
MSEVDHRTWKGTFLNSTYAKIGQGTNDRKLWYMVVFGGNHTPVAAVEGLKTKEDAIQAAVILGFAPSEISED